MVNQDRAFSILQRLSQKVFPVVHWSQHQNLASGLIQMVGQKGDQVAVASLIWVNSRKGTDGYYYLVSAPRESFGQLETTFAEILKIFHVKGTQA